MKRSDHRVESFIILLFLGATLFFPCVLQAVDSPEGRYQEARKAYDELKASPDKNKSRSRWLKVAKRFEKVAKAYPQSERALDARFTAGRIYQDLYRQHQKSGDREQSLEDFKWVWETDPKGKLADDALYQAAFVYWNEMKDPIAARNLLERLLREYPEGDQVTKARILMGSLPGSANQRLFAVKPQGIHIDAKDGKVVHISLPLGKSVQVNDQLMQNPERKLVLDLHGAELLGEGVKPIPVNHASLKRIRMGQFSQDTVRVVFDLPAASDYSVSRMENPDSLRVTIRAANSTKSGKSTKPLKVATKAKSPAVKLIALDAGHGGDDPGTIGPKGTKEKDITLQITKRLQRQIEHATGAKTFLTRDTDVFVPLEQRSNLANERKADLFISIHCNAHPNKSMRGIQTYFLDTIKDEYSRKLAARENAISLERLSDLEMILMDLSNRESHERSSKFAGLLQHQLIHQMNQKYRSVNDLGVRTAVFLVLFYAEMPAVLVETSFLSNKQEEERLRSESYQEALAQSIVQGVKEYIAQGDKIVGTL